LDRPCPHTGAATPAHRQAQRIQQDGFARPGFAGQDIEAGGEFQRRLLDQDDIADGQG
jgi:hypothetical protein